MSTTIKNQERKMRNQAFRTIIMLAVALVCISGCDRIKAWRSKPDEELAKYLEASKNNMRVEAYQYISARDKAFKSIQEYMAEASEPKGVLANILTAKISYAIKEVKAEGERAKASVQVNEPDFEKIISELPPEFFQPPSKKQKEKPDLPKLLEEKYKGKYFPMKSEIRVFELVKEKKGWKVFLNWEQEKKVEGLVSQAGQLEAKGELARAKDMCRQALELDSASKGAAETLASIEKKIAVMEELKAYYKKVKVRNLKIKETPAGGLGIFGEVKNYGDHPLAIVEITIYYYDKEKALIFEESYLPVDTIEDPRQKNKPLKPGKSRKFGYSAVDAPMDKTKDVKVKVSKIEFVK